MREIEFRAKAINRDPDAIYRTNYRDGDWVFGLLTRYEDKIYNLCALMTDISGISGIYVDINTLGQYTGRNDKNNIKIFDGDIILYKRTKMYAPGTDFDGKDLTSKHLIYWDEEKSSFRQRHYDEGRLIGSGNIEFLDHRAEENIIEVIGNIFDNPELLEVNL